MNNQERKLFNIATKIEKLLYEHCSITFFNKTVTFNAIYINTDRKELEWDFIEPFTDLMKKDNISFSIFADEENVLKIKILL